MPRRLGGLLDHIRVILRVQVVQVVLGRLREHVTSLAPMQFRIVESVVHLLIWGSIRGQDVSYLLEDLIPNMYLHDSLLLGLGPLLNALNDFGL